MKPPPPDLNPSELETLGILWDDSPLKPGEIQERFSRPTENATLRSILVGLVEKGYLKRVRKGKAYYYRPRAAAAKVRRQITERMAAVFAQGSRIGLIAQLIKDEKLTPAQIRELEQYADRNNHSKGDLS